MHNGRVYLLVLLCATWGGGCTYQSAAPSAAATVVIAQAEAGAVPISGTGKEAFRTRGALERQGFRLRDDAPLRIEVIAGSEGTNWRLIGAGKQQEFDSLDSLLSDVKS